MFYKFRIGDFCFSMDCQDTLTIPQNLFLFQTAAGEPEYHYRIQTAARFPAIKGELLADRQDLQVLRTPTGECRYLAVGDTGICYAFYQELSDREALVMLHENFVSDSFFDTVFVSLLALERRMQKHNGLILHSAFMENHSEAILFSAPSGTGKSTQADLWGKYRGCRTLNGDRSLLQKLNGRWIAEGWPVCGSSEICYNEERPIKAIVMLSQKQYNKAERLRPIEAFRQVYGQITVNGWNPEATGQTMNLIMDLIENVPFYHLGCTISEEAVECLEDTIYNL